MLNNKILADAKPGEEYWDESVRGLHLRVTKTGRKAWYLSYRTKAGQQRRPKLADIGVMSLDQARKAARESLARVALGADPGADWRMERLAPTVGELADQWLDDHAAQVKPKTLRENTRIVKEYVKPKLGRLKAAVLQHEDVDDLHKSLSATPYMANRVLAVVSGMFNYAEKRRLRMPGTNPCRHVRHFKEDKRRRYMRRDEAHRVAAVLAKYEDTRTNAVAFIYILILSGARPDEISRTLPEWITPVGAGGILRLPDSKTGARTVFLPPQVMRICEKLPKIRNGTLLGIKSPKSLWDEVREEAGVPDLRLYDLRHTFASAALEAGYSLDQIGELLGHASVQTTKRYAHLVDEKAHEAAANTAGLLERMMAATPVPALPQTP